MSAVLCYHFANWLNNWRYRTRVSLISLEIFLLAFIISWIGGFSEVEGIIFHSLFWIGLAWFAVILLVFVSQASHRYRSLVLVLLICLTIIGTVILFDEKWQGGVFLIIITLLAFPVAIGRWRIWDTFTL